MTAGPRHVVNVETAVYRDGEYLLVERAADEDHASGQLALVGGRVEPTVQGTGAFEDTARREIREEVDVGVTDLTYVQSNAFTTDTGTDCLNVVFLARHDEGEPTVAEPEEVAAVHWLAPDDVEPHPDCPEWTAAFVALAEERRQSLGW
ncbi:NUDIX domain-containing protein [Haloarchaeobius baliensis]|uniref:NUDIX domain-containing protein n=1 Tax=Haloarchaeobius baliensis TaxID=1670458 RepID=UPI003F881B86